jgi:hypothetical protein
MKINDGLYVITNDNKARFVLGTHGNNPLICIGINPSTATPDEPDRTIKWLGKFAEHKGFDSYIMLNVYPQRATNPNDMHIRRDDCLHKENIQHIKRVFKQLLDGKPRTILAIWGVSIELRPWLKDCLHDIINEIQNISPNCRWKCLGLIKEGHPRYPRSIKATAKYEDFDCMRRVHTPPFRAF